MKVVVGAYAVIMILFYAFSLFLSLAAYLCTGFSILKISNKLSIKNGFFGFIPFLNSYKLGEIAECCCQRKGLNKKYAKLLLGLEIGMMAAIIPMVIALVFLAVATEGAEGYYNPDGIAIVSVGFMLLFMVLMIAVSITYSVFTYIALYRIYSYFEEKNAVLFIVLSILVSIACPVLLLIIALKKENLQFEGFNQFNPQPQGVFQTAENQNTTQE